MSKASGTFVDEVPVARSRVPLAGALQVFCTQMLSAGIASFGIGSGVPKLQPVFVQSGSLVLTGGIAAVGPIVQLEPVQSSANRLLEPSGVGPSGTMEMPPPMLTPPQVRLLMGVEEPSSVWPHVPPAEDRVKSRSWVTGGGVVLVADVQALRRVGRA